MTDYDKIKINCSAIELEGQYEGKIPAIVGKGRSSRA